MGTTTEKLNLVLPYESDYFNIGDFNGNFTTIDALTHITASASTTATKYAINTETSTPDGTATWYYKKYDDGTFEANTFLTYTNLRCNSSQGEVGTYRSGYVVVNLPNIGITDVRYSNVSCKVSTTGATFQWAIDTTPTSSRLQRFDFCLVGMKSEDSSVTITKEIYIEVKGTWA